MIIKPIKKVFIIKAFSRELKISPIFVETTASMIAGVFMILWGFTFFSNSTFQYSIYTKIRNIFISEEKKKEMMSGIYTFALDYEAMEVARERGYDDYDMLEESIRIIRDYAKQNPDKKIVIGLDFVFVGGANEKSDIPKQIDFFKFENEFLEKLSNEDDKNFLLTYYITDNNKTNYNLKGNIDDKTKQQISDILNSIEYDNLIGILSEIPENLYIIFGGALQFKDSQYSFLRTDFLYKKIINPVVKKSNNGENIKKRKLFIGDIHYIKSGVKNGLENDAGDKIALGYQPLKHKYKGSDNHYIMSLPFSMLFTGEIDQNNIDVTSDIFASETILGNNAKEKVKSFIGRDFKYLQKEFRYNFFTANDASELNNNSLNLSNFSKKFSYSNNDKPLQFYFFSKKQTNNNKAINNDKTEYFFIYMANPPVYVPDEDMPVDTIITPASQKSKFTYEYGSIHGVMAHVIALSNLKNSYLIENVPEWLNILILIAILVFIFLISWNNDLAKSSVISISAVILFLIASFILFVKGYFLPVRLPLALSFFVFGMAVLARFFYTTKNIDIYQETIRKIFSPAQLRQIESNEENCANPSVIRDGVIMVLFLKELPDIGSSESSALRYTKIIEKYTGLIFNIIEKHEGSHDLLYMDGIIGFWNVPVRSEESEQNALDCAKRCIEKTDNLQRYIENKSGEDDEKYTVNFDIVLHKCDFFAGCIGRGEIKNYAISSSEVNFAISAARSQTLDKSNSILLTEEFYKAVKDEIKGKIKRVKFGSRELVKL